jgi:hypothetical protein
MFIKVCSFSMEKSRKGHAEKGLIEDAVMIFVKRDKAIGHQEAQREYMI